MYDVAIVGGGIVGLATAMALRHQFPALTLIVLEKEPQLGAHQTSHNSGVIHSGLYYRPGSLKAATCVAGTALLVEFCQAHRIPYERCGKLVVATEPSELPRLQALYERGVANDVPGLQLIGGEQIRELEPHARGLRAIHVPSAGIVDYAAVAQAMGELIQRQGAVVRTSTKVRRLLRRAGRWTVETTAGDIASRVLITCAGLHADRVAAMTEAPRDLQIIPFRGEYYDVVPARRFLVRTMIYPVPDPRFPFLGAHFTRTIAGGLHAGPNAVLALKREGYRKRDMSPADALRLLSYPGFWHMTRRYWRTGLAESYRSFSKGAFVRSLQRLVPEIQPADLARDGSGVRAQAVDHHGSLLDDFNVVQTEGAIHVRNVPSPAATASIRLGQLITDMAASTFGWARS